MTRLRPLSLLFVAALLAACQVAVVPRAAGSRPAAATAPSEAPVSAPVSPATSAAPAAPAPAPVAMLQRPTTPSQVLTGRVLVDSGYMVASAGGTQWPDAPYVIAGLGGTVDADGRVSSQNGSAVVSAGAGNVIATQAGAIISNDGASLVGQDGAGIISGGAGNYRTLAVGEPHPVKAAVGMRIEAVSLADGKPVPVGVDADSKPVYAIYSNAEGQYTLYVPGELVSNVQVIARVPGASDPRLAYDLVTAPSTSRPQDLDEETAILARYLRGAFRGKLEAILSAPNAEDPAFLAGLFAASESGPLLESFTREIVTTLRQTVRDAGVPPSRYGAASERGAATLLAYARLHEAKVDVRNTDWSGDPQELAIDALRDVFTRLTQGADRRFTALGPQFFTAQPYFRAAHHGATTQVAILKPADLADFVVTHYLAGLDPQAMKRIVPVAVSVGVEVSQVDHLFAGAAGIALSLGTTFATDPDAKAAVLAAIAGYGTQALPATR